MTTGTPLSIRHPAPTLDEQRSTLLEHFQLATALHGEASAARQMRKFGIKFSSHHPTPEPVKAAFVRCSTLAEWQQRLRDAVGDGFPDKVTAFRDGMAVHGRFGEPCPECGSPVQRIVYAANECNYCARCQTGGKLLADRVLSRLLKSDWPRTLEELDGTAVLSYANGPDELVGHVAKRVFDLGASVAAASASRSSLVTGPMLASA